MESHNARAGLRADAHIARAARLSRYAKRLIEAEPVLELDAGTRRPFSAEDMRAFLEAQPSADDDALKRALRALRKRVMLRLIARDLGGLAALSEVMATATGLAEVTLTHALASLDERLAARHGRPASAQNGHVQQLHVVGMGKLGGAELNVSSDIDLVFVYPEDGETRGPRPISNHEYFARLGRELIAALSEMTAEGHVFRVDMRLRPYGDGGPLVSSFEVLENYFITQGREWERYAWLKARALTGNRGAELTELVRPFVYRRHLDYNALAALRDLHRQMADFLKSAADAGLFLESELQRLSARHGLGEVRGRGLLLALDLKLPIGASIVAQAFSDGVLLNSPQPDALRFMPALNVTREEISLMIECLDAVLVKAGAARRVA